MLIPRLTKVHHITEDIEARIIGYIDFRDMGLEGCEDVRYVLQGQFSDGHNCNGARQFIKWAKGPSQEACYWYAAEEDFTIVEESHEVDEALIALGAKVQYTPLNIPTCTVVGYNYDGDTGEFISYTLRIEGAKLLQYHDGISGSTVITQTWMEGYLPAPGNLIHWFASAQFVRAV